MSAPLKEQASKQDGSRFIAQTNPKAFSVGYTLFCPEVRATTGWSGAKMQ